MTPGEIVSRFCLGESVSALASEMVPLGDDAVTWAAALDAKAEEIEGIIRADLQWLYEVEGIAKQASANLSAALAQVSIDHADAIDTDDHARGYRLGISVGAAAASDAVGHLTNVINARAMGLTRETKAKEGGG